MYELTDIEDEWAYLTLGGRYGAVSLCRGASEEPDGTEWRLPDEEWIAACRLAGAAPELLSACRAIRDDLRKLVFTDGYYQLSAFSATVILRLLDERIGAAMHGIAKAEGRSE